MKKEVSEYIKIIKYTITFIFVIYAVVSIYEICFNPCFNGYYTSTSFFMNKILLIIAFQSLF